MERRVAGIIRWLERCVSAYKDGAVESALMDAECARADMETLRGDLWKKLGDRVYARKHRLGFLRAAEVIFCALGVMLFAATPLALSQNAPARAELAENPLSLEWVTPDEMKLLTNVRKRPDASLAKAPATEEPAAKLDAALLSIPAAQAASSAPEKTPTAARAAAPARRGSPEPSRAPATQNTQKAQETQEKSLTYDNILSLIETGERAMRHEPPVITIEDSGVK